MESPRQQCMQIFVDAFLELELTIPNLGDRMCVRMVRMLIENGVLELQREGCNSWEQIVVIYFEMRGAIAALSEMNPGSASSRLCDSIFRGLCALNNDGTKQNNNEVMERCGTGVGVITFLMQLYDQMWHELEELIQDEDFLGAMGPNGPNCFEKIISTCKLVKADYEKIITDLISYSDS